MKERFDCVVLSRADLEDMGFDTSGVPDERMERFADKIGEILIGELYWESLETLATLWQIPRTKKNLMDGFYNKKLN